MQFTPDGYTEPLSPRIHILGLGVLVMVAGIALGALFSWCAASVLIVIGLLVALNEGGQKRVRITRRHMLMEKEYRVWGLLIGPVRDRIRWESTKSVSVAGDRVKLETTDGQVHEFGVGGSESDLKTFCDRVQQRLENFRNPM